MGSEMCIRDSQGANVGYTPSWKKAVVTLTEDSKEIEFFNDMM